MLFELWEDESGLACTLLCREDRVTYEANLETLGIDRKLVKRFEVEGFEDARQVHQRWLRAGATSPESSA